MFPKLGKSIDTIWGISIALAIAAMPVAPAQSEGSALPKDPATCREVIAESLQNQGSILFPRTLVLTPLERLARGGSVTRAQVATSLDGVITENSQKEKLIDQAFAAATAGQESPLCRRSSRETVALPSPL